LGKPFKEEIDRLHLTTDWALQQDTTQFKHLISRWTDGPLIVVGSGGSYSAAVAWAYFHRSKTGAPCFPSTPMELGELISTLKECRVILLSAEGKNNDILNAAKLAKAEDVPCAALTLTLENPLVEFSKAERALYSFAYSMDWGKDGYLATNTLFAMVTLAAKIYFNISFSNVEPIVNAAVIAKRRTELRALPELGRIHDAGALVLHGPESALVAIDLESKLTEAAIAKCEIVDFRQFSHGRHLQLTQPITKLPVVIVVHTEKERDLAQAMIRWFPDHITRVEVALPDMALAQTNICALVETFLLIEAVGQSINIDPGQPDVPEFGREIYRLDSAEFKALPTVLDMRGIAIKRKINGAIVSNEHHELISKSADRYLDKLEAAKFKALIFDFDGTLCHVHQRYAGMDPRVQAQLLKLLESGLAIGIATGRGRKITEIFKNAFPKDFWDLIWVGVYSGSVIARLSNQFIVPAASDDLFSALDWLESSVLNSYAVEGRSECKAGQLSLRLGDHAIAERVKNTLSAWILETGKTGWRVFSSGHSVDLLDASTTKVSVINQMVSDLNLNSDSEILLLGDAGHAGGNDFEMLRNRHSLSADKVSDSLDCCWNFAPSGVRQADATNFYLNALSIESGVARLNLKASRF